MSRSWRATTDRPRAMAIAEILEWRGNRRLEIEGIHHQRMRDVAADEHENGDRLRVSDDRDERVELRSAPLAVPAQNGERQGLSRALGGAEEFDACRIALLDAPHPVIAEAKPQTEPLVLVPFVCVLEL